MRSRRRNTYRYESIITRKTKYIRKKKKRKKPRKKKLKRTGRKDENNSQNQEHKMELIKHRRETRTEKDRMDPAAIKGKSNNNDCE